MMIIENLPSIEGGTDKQKMFAESVRLNFISFVEEHAPDKLSDAELVIAVRLDYRWWIDRVNKINLTGIKTMISGTKSAITRAGSIELALESQKKAAEAKKNAWLNSRPLGGILDNIRKEI